MISLKILSFLVLLTGPSVLSIELPEKSDSTPLEWWQEEVVYQIYPRSHQDSDADGIGDLKGIESRLSHFSELGIGSVWISPIYESPMVDFGYDISNFTAIDPQFGTLEDFRILKAHMKARGIKLIMDFVPNHSSDKHDWFLRSINKQAPYTDYYVWRDASDIVDGEPLPPNNWLSVFGGSAWKWNAQRQQFYLHQFTEEQPDLNYRNEELVQEISNAIYFWLQEGVDGFRMDAVPHIFEDPNFGNEEFNPNPPANSRCEEGDMFDHICLIHDKTYNLPEVFPLLARFRQLIDLVSIRDGNPRVMMVEATIPTLDELFDYYGNNEKSNNLPIAHYPFNFEFINRIKPQYGSIDGFEIASLIDEWFTKMPEGQTANWLLGNHDNSRVGSRFGEAFIDPLNMINLLLPGSAVTYYGEEIGMTDRNLTWEETVDPPACNAGRDRYHLFSRDPARTPMQWNGNELHAGFSKNETWTWLPVHQNYVEVNVDVETKSTRPSHLQVYNKTVQLRKTNVWRYGSLESGGFEDGTGFGFTRFYKDQGFVFLANFGNETKNVNLTRLFKRIPPTGVLYLTSAGFSPDTALGSVVLTDQFIIGRKHAAILTFDVEFDEDDDNQGTSTTEEDGGPPENTTPEEDVSTSTDSSAATNYVGAVSLLAALFVSAFARY